MHRVELPAAKAAFVNDLFRRYQLAWESLQVIAALGGDNYILKGCTVSGGTSVSSGVMVINGEVAEFQGGTIPADPYIIVEEVPNEKVIKTGSYTELDRYAKFGNGDNQVAWSSIRRFDKDVPTLSAEVQALNDKAAALLIGLSEGWDSMIMYGCQVETLSIDTYGSEFSMEAGCVYIGGNIYTVDAHTFVSSISDGNPRWLIYEENGEQKAYVNEVVEAPDNYDFDEAWRLKA